MKAKESYKLKRRQHKFLELPVVKGWIQDGNEDKQILTGYHFTARHLKNHLEPSLEYSIRFHLRTNS